MLTRYDIHKKINITSQAAAITLFFIAAAFSQGLYFPRQYITANTILILYMLYIIYKKGRRMPITLATISLFAFFSIYLLSIFYGVNREGAIYEVLRIFAYLPVFIIGALCDEYQRKCIDRAVIISGVMVSIIGLLNLAQILNMDGTLYGQRIQSTFHYANVTAVYLMIGIILCLKEARSLELGARREKSLVRGVINVCIYTLACGLILTYSRGVWIIFALFNIYLLLSRQFLDKFDKIRYIYLLIMSGAVSILLASIVFTKWFVVILLIGVIFSALPEYLFFATHHPLPTTHYYANAIRLLSTVGLAAVSLFHSSILIRLSNISLNATEWTARTAYYKGALKLMKDYPLFGSGAMGWAALCEKYAGDYVKYVHNYYLHILTDVGIAGFAFFAVFMVSVMKEFLKSKRKDVYSALIVGTIVTHSLIDIDMHFQLIAIIFFLYAGFITIYQVEE